MKNSVKPNIFIPIILLFCTAIVLSCSKDGKQPLAKEKQTDVYVAGYTGIGSGKVWKNGTVLHDVADSRNRALSVYVSNGDVYATGYRNRDGLDVAVLWKNDTSIDLTDGGRSASAQSVYVSGGDAYVAGHDGWVAKIWKNGSVLYALTNGTRCARANSVYVSGSDIYAVGYECDEIYDRDRVAKVWKNGLVLHTLTERSQLISEAYSVYVSGSDVYVAGFTYDHMPTTLSRDVATVWKNGEVLYTLTDGTRGTGYAFSIYVSSGDVYVAGDEFSVNRYVAKVWKNGTVLYNLNDGGGSASARAMHVLGNDVYVAGYERREFGAVAKVWKNGTLLHNIDSDSEYQSNFAYSLFVDQTEK